MQLIFVSGLSGSGKTVALHMLEDLGFYCIDNIPAGLLHTIVKHMVDSNDPAFARIAIGIDARNRPADIGKVPELFDKLNELSIDHEVMFFHASEEELLTRYSETRRKHPLSGEGTSLREALNTERRLLDPISRSADHTVDTTGCSVHELREIVRMRVSPGGSGDMALQFVSFGFKNGMPNDADFVFDVRFLPNPYWDKALRSMTGKDEAVQEFFSASAQVTEKIGDIIKLLESWLPEFQANNRSYLTVAIGCTGGQHRSVYVAERIAEYFRASYSNVSCRHSALNL